MDIKILKQIVNKRGELKQKTVRITNKITKDGLKFDTVNQLYVELLLKYKAQDFTIIAKPKDGGYITLKNKFYSGKDLLYADEDYFNDTPHEIREKLLGIYYSIDIIISI